MRLPSNTIALLSGVQSIAAPPRSSPAPTLHLPGRQLARRAALGRHDEQMRVAVLEIADPILPVVQSCSTTRGAGVHFAPFGSAGMLIVHFSCSGTNIENAIDLPSGDHFALRGVSVTCVICVAGPSTSTQRTKICEPFGSPSARYSSRLPSGDQRAFRL